MDIRQLGGTTIDEYTLTDLIGEGGMSAVYRAYQAELERYVAIKILSPELLRQEGYLERFRSEAKMAASLEHPHIVPVYDYGEVDDVMFVAMRLLGGGTLHQRLRGGQPLPVSDIVSILETMARALDYAHGRGIVHRDVKPGNVMFDEQGTAYLVDFGIAKLVQSDLSLTAENIALGTPSYMPPEQWRGDTLTPAVDQYALAVVGYRMLTGKLPYTAESPPEVMYKHLHETPIPLHQINPNLPSAVDEVFQRALAKEPQNRFPIVTNFSNALKLALTTHPSVSLADMQQPTQAPPQPAPEPQLPRQGAQPRQQPIPQPVREESTQTLFMQFAKGGMIGVGVLAMLLILVVVGIFLALRPNEPPTAATNPTPTADITLESPTTIPQVGITLTPITFEGIEPAQIGSGRIIHQQLQVTVRDVAYSPDGVMVAAAHSDGSVRLWQRGVLEAPTVLSGHSDVVSAVAFSPNGSLLASGGSDTGIRVWDTQTGQTRFVLSGHAGAIRDLDFSPDGTRLASASEDATIRIWDMASGGLIRTINGKETRLLTVAYSPDGTQLASGGEGVRVRRWDAETGGELNALLGHSEQIRSVDYSPNGQLLASSSTDNTIRIWNFASGQTVHILEGHGRDVWKVAFNGDGSLLASGGRDNNLRLWDVQSGSQLANLTGHEGWVLGVAFHPDGSQIVSGSGDGTVRVWQVDS